MPTLANSFSFLVAKPQLVMTLAIIIVVLMVFQVVMKKLQPAPRKELDNTDAELPYTRHAFVLSKAERSFFMVLLKTVPETCFVFPKMRLADVLTVRKGTQNWQRHFNRISAKHVDFVVCDRQTFQPLLVIELDDSSHDRPDRQDRDVFVRDALEGAGLPLHSEPARQAYVISELQGAIWPALAKLQSK